MPSNDSMVSCAPGVRWFVLMLVCVATLAAGTVADAQETPAPSAPTATAAEPADPPPSHWQDRVDKFFGKWLLAPLESVLFFDFYTGRWLGVSVPFVVVWLMGGAIYLTFRMSWINLRCLVHAVRVTKGDYDDPSDAGDISHFQALSSALSATVGLGNIAGVAIAVSLGGPGAVFWMVFAGLFGMTSKFTECTLGQAYRRVEPDGHVLGGPMMYLKAGLEERGVGRLGAGLSLLFAMLCIGASFGGGCAFQVSQSMNLVRAQLPTAERMVDGVAQDVSLLYQSEWVYGVVMAFFVGIVILGGIRRIATTAEAIVPLMCGVYLLAGIAILLMHFAELPSAFGSILANAFKWDSAYGGLIGVMVVGFQRAAFSNEAGCGSAAIAHSAARTKYPIREGLVACLEPFIDTVVICTMTGMVIVVTGVFDTERFPDHAEIISSKRGAHLTSIAFQQDIKWFPYLLTSAVVLFAYSTMISWSYYGERCSTYLFGHRASFPYKCLFLLAVVLGAVIKAPNVLNFSDAMILSMAFPNMLGLLLLSGRVRRKLDEYWNEYKQGEFKVYTKSDGPITPEGEK